MNLKKVYCLMLTVFILGYSVYAKGHKPNRIPEILETFHKLQLREILRGMLLSLNQSQQLIKALRIAQDSIASVIEKESQAIVKIEGNINKAYIDVDKGIFPKQEDLYKYENMFKQFNLKREQVIRANTNTVLNVVNMVLHPWQKDAIVNTSKMKSQFAKLNADERMKIFIKQVLLDPLTVNLLSTVVEVGAKKPKQEVEDLSDK